MSAAPVQPTEENALDPKARAAARLGAVQALYQMDVAATPLDDAIEEFVERRP